MSYIRKNNFCTEIVRIGVVLVHLKHAYDRMVVCDGSLLKRKGKMSCLDIEKKKKEGKKKKSKVVGLRKIFVKKKKEN